MSEALEESAPPIVPIQISRIGIVGRDIREPGSGTAAVVLTAPILVLLSLAQRTSMAAVTLTGTRP